MRVVIIGKLRAIKPFPLPFQGRGNEIRKGDIDKRD